MTHSHRLIYFIPYNKILTTVKWVGETRITFGNRRREERFLRQMNLDFDYWEGKAKEENPTLFDAPEKNGEDQGLLETPFSDAATQVSCENPVLEAKNDGSLENTVFCSVDDAARPSYNPETGEIVDTSEHRSAASVCKAVFLGVPFGIPLFAVMIVLISAVLAAACLVFGALVTADAALLGGSISLMLLGISNVHIMLSSALLLFGTGLLGCGLSVFLALAARLFFNYVFPALFRCYTLPIRFIKLFFARKKHDNECFESPVEAETPERKNHIVTISIVAGVLVFVGFLVSMITYFVYYNDEIPANMTYKHKVSVDADIMGIDVSSSYFNVTIERGDELYVLFEDTYAPGTEVKVEDGILRITGEHCDKIDLFGFEMSPASKILDLLGGDVTIVVPEDVFLQLVYADIGCGSFRMKDVSCARLVTQVGIGSITLDNSDAQYERFLECKLGTVYDNGEMKLALNHSSSSSER